MSSTATPQPHHSVLRAVIEEARNRARRRRKRYTLLAVLVVAAAVGAYFSMYRGGVSGSGASLARPLQRIEIVPTATPRANGALTIMDVQANAKHEGPAGWYSISTVDRLGRLHTLARCPGHVRQCGWVESIDWSPDGRRLAFAVTTISNKSRLNGIHVLDLRTGRDLLILKEGQYAEHDWPSLDWSPDGKRLAYTANGGIAVINADGSGRRLLRPPKDRFDRSPSWSPDGAWIAFASSGPQEYPGIWAMRADGSQRRQLVRSGATPAWSPDGSRIAFHAPLAQIEFVSPNGTLLAPRPPFRVGTSVGINGPPVWSPDGKKIAMASRRLGTYVMNADGTALERLTPHGVGVSMGEPPRLAWRPLVH